MLNSEELIGTAECLAV